VSFVLEFIELLKPLLVWLWLLDELLLWYLFP
jgi:hypothetical protein